MEIPSREYDAALKKITDYCLCHPGCGSFQIIVETRLPPEVVLRAIQQLRTDGIVDIQQ